MDMWRTFSILARIIDIEGKHKHEFDAIGVWEHVACFLCFQNSFYSLFCHPAAHPHLKIAHFYNFIEIEA
jgi:hypothetical protein